MVPGTCQSRSPVRAERPVRPSAPPGACPTVRRRSGAVPSSTASQPAVSSMGTREPSASRRVPLYADAVQLLSMKTPARAGWSHESVPRATSSTGSPDAVRTQAWLSTARTTWSCDDWRDAVPPASPVARGRPRGASTSSGCHRSRRPWRGPPTGPVRARRGPRDHEQVVDEGQSPAAVDLPVRQQGAVGGVEHPDGPRQGCPRRPRRTAGRCRPRRGARRAARACTRSTAPATRSSASAGGSAGRPGCATRPAPWRGPDRRSTGRRTRPACRRRAPRPPPTRTGARARAPGPPARAPRCAASTGGTTPGMAASAAVRASSRRSRTSWVTASTPTTSATDATSQRAC